MAGSGGASWLTQARDRVRRAQLSRNSGDLVAADVGPDAIDFYRRALDRAPEALGQDALIRAIMQAPVAASR